MDSTQAPPGGTRPLKRDFATPEEVAAAGGIAKGSLNDWVRAGLLPTPEGTGGRGNRSRFPLIAVELAAFIKGHRDLGFGVPEIRPRIIKEFGDEVAALLPEPRPSRSTLRRKVANAHA